MTIPHEIHAFLVWQRLSANRFSGQNGGWMPKGTFHITYKSSGSDSMS
jgi:hypothetical protein